MGKKTTIWIMSVLFSLGIIAAYHSEGNSQKVKSIHVGYQGRGATDILEKSKRFLAEELAKDGIQVKSIVFTKAMKFDINA